MMIDLRENLAHALRFDFPATVALDHPNVRAIAHFIIDLLYTDTGISPPPAPSTPEVEAEDELGSLSLDELVNAIHDDLHDME